MREITFVVYVRALMTQKSCAVGMHNAILRNHLKKCQTMNIGHRPETTGFKRAGGEIRKNNREISTAETLEPLGVTIDPRLYFPEHVNSTCKKAR